MKRKISKELSEIRRQAEEQVAHSSAEALTPASGEKDRLIHELNVHQAELEIQNEELRRAQLELEDSRNKYVDLYDFAPVGYLTLDRKGMIIQASLKTAEMLGIPRLKLIGQPFSKHIHHADRDIFYAHHQAAMTTGTLTQCDLRLQPGKNAPVRHVHLQTTAESQGAPENPRLLSAMIDITERREAEERLLESEANLRDEALRKDEFLAMLAHELRNPLAPIRNAGHLLRAIDIQHPALTRLREMIERQVGHMARLLDDLLDISRITRGKIVLRMQLLDLRQAADTAVDNSNDAALARHHQVHYERPEEPVWIKGDPTRVEQIISNLLNNAIKYTDPGGHIVVSVGRESLRKPPNATAAVVRVRDDGMGISPEMLPHIFDLFAQAERTLDRAQGGLGIGLTLVRRLAELHGGQVWANSEGLGTGSEFAVQLPLVTALPEELCLAAAAPASGPAEQGPSAPGEPRNFRVLVVDDVEDNARSLAELLALWGHRTALAFDGPTALREAAAFSPEVVLLDIGLPGEDGFAVARKLRKEYGNDMLLIALTGYGREEDARQSREVGINHHLTKPVNLSTLQEILAQHADHRPMPENV